LNFAGRPTLESTFPIPDQASTNPSDPVGQDALIVACYRH